MRLNNRNVLNNTYTYRTRYIKDKTTNITVQSHIVKHISENSDCFKINIYYAFDEFEKYSKFQFTFERKNYVY